MTGSKIKALRHKLNMSQAQFWTPLGVTQSGGSRYENERFVPAPVQRLLYLVYEHRILQHLSTKETKHFMSLGK